MRTPRYVHVETDRHGNEVVYFRRGQGARHRLPKLKHLLFKRAYAAALSGEPIPHVRAPGGAARQRALVRRALRAARIDARGRAIQKGLPFALPYEWVAETAERQKYRCSLTGIPFLAEPPGPSAKHLFAPSLDRILPADGYVTGNVRLVVFAINVMLADWGIEVFELACAGYRSEAKTSTLFPADLPGAGECRA